MTHGAAKTAKGQRAAGARRAYTLIELVISVAMAAILLTGLTSALVLASRALPDDTKPADRLRQQSDVLQQLAADLEYAQYVVERGAHAVTIVVADRNGDGRPERIRYAWSGTQSDPLTRQLNGGTAAAILDDVHQFDLTYDLTSTTESYPGPPVEGSEIELSNYTACVQSGDYNVDSKHWIGQYIQPVPPSIPVTTISWSVTRAQFMAKRADLLSRTLHAQIRSANADFTPTAVALGDTTFNQMSLPLLLYGWKEVTFTTVTGLSPGAGVCFVITRDSDPPGAVIQYDSKSGSGYVATSNGEGHWNPSSTQSMLYHLYGKVTTAGPAQTAVRQFVSGVRAALQTGPDTNLRLDTTVRLLNSPEVLAAVWEASFDSDPTALDVTADGVSDWARHDGQAFNASSLVGATWHADATLDTRPDNDFTQMTTVDVRFRNTSVGGNGAVFAINADWSGGTFAPLLAYAQLQADGTQTVSVYKKTSDTTPVLLSATTGLTSAFVNLRLLIDPSLNTVYIKVNDLSKGTFPYSTYTPPGATGHVASVMASGSAAEFDTVRIRVTGS